MRVVVIHAFQRRPVGLPDRVQVRLDQEFHDDAALGVIGRVVGPIAVLVDAGQERAEGVHRNQLVGEVNDRHTDAERLIDRGAIEVGIQDAKAGPVVQGPLDGGEDGGLGGVAGSD